MQYHVLCPLLAVVPIGSAAEVHLDCAKPAGIIRALHGGNSGPVQYGGVLDFSKELRELAVPLIRLHDCNWPNSDVVDIHTIFPDPTADPALISNYDFRRTDDYLKSTTATGSGIVYRLGESIEHTARKYHVHPPKDPAQWAAICTGIIRHYNEGWGDGFEYGIRYWEIWNEPENQPAMWTGTDEEYFQLYETTARAIKARWPKLMVGGPALGYTGRVEAGRFVPGDFLLKFLAVCRDRKVPLDFFSWHLYTNNPAECQWRAQGIREALDQHGFTMAELHLNEWNYLPDNDWTPMSLAGQGRARKGWFGRIHGAEGAAFAASVLSNLQDSRVEVANFYAFTHHGFGVFDPDGVPHPPYYALLAFRHLLETPRRITVKEKPPQGLTVLAGKNEAQDEIRVLLSNLSTEDKTLRLHLENIPWKGGSKFEISVVAPEGGLELVRSGMLRGHLELGELLDAPSVGLLKIRPSSE